MTNPIKVQQADREAAILLAGEMMFGLGSSGEYDPLIAARAFAHHAEQARLEERERCAAIVEGRRSIYQAKHDTADPLAEDDGNRFDRMRHTVEAHDILIGAIRKGEAA